MVALETHQAMSPSDKKRCSLEHDTVPVTLAQSGRTVTGIAHERQPPGL
ncbi:hypothetical protein [Halomonas sp. A29]